MSGDRYDFTDENVSRSPQTHGVYQLEEGAEITYIGRAWGTDVTIRSRLQAHKRGDEGRCTQVAKSYRREETEAAVSRERELLEEYENSHGGNRPKCNERPA